MTDKVKKDNLTELKVKLEQNFEEKFKKFLGNNKLKFLDIVIVYQIVIILAQLFSNENERKELIIGIVFLAIYFFIRAIFFLKQKIKNKYLIALLILQMVNISVLSYVSFTKLTQFINDQNEKSLIFLLQIAYHSHIIILFSSQNIFLQSRIFILWNYLVLQFVNFIAYAICVVIKVNENIQFTVQNVVLEVAVAVIFTTTSFLLYYNTRSNYDFIKTLSYQSDLEKQKFKKLEFFLASLEDQQFILVQQQFANKNQTKNKNDKLLDNEFIETNGDVKEKMDKMHQKYLDIISYESDEKSKKFKDLLDKSSKDEWKKTNLYSFNLKQKFQESLVVKFVGFQDLQTKQGKNGIDLDKSMHYYAIQLVQNKRILFKISRKISILREFLKQIKEDVKNDMNLQKQISFQEDYCEIILKEIDLYIFIFLPKDKLMYSLDNNPQKQTENIENFSIQNIQQRMSIFFQLYSKVKEKKKVILTFAEKNQTNLKFTKEIYLRIIHIIINLIINFTDYSKQIDITFIENTSIKIWILHRDEIDFFQEEQFKNILQIEDSFEYLINKIQNVGDKTFNYHKEPPNKGPYDREIIFTFNFSKPTLIKQKVQNDNYQLQDYSNLGIQDSSNQLRNNNKEPFGGQLLIQQKDINFHRNKQKELTFNIKNYDQSQTQRPLTNYTQF